MMREGPAREHLHVPPGGEARAPAWTYSVLEEGVVPVEGRDLVYVLGDAAVGSACVGGGMVRVVVVPGFMLLTEAARTGGSRVSLVEPVRDEGMKERIRAALAVLHPHIQAVFL
ncbi:MAG: hypothetical protein JXA20_17865 [Spirochaetes bacterium]|nr:hypothetical protein [Spirochaetota bacterium]